MSIVQQQIALALLERSGSHLNLLISLEVLRSNNHLGHIHEGAKQVIDEIAKFVREVKNEVR